MDFWVTAQLSHSVTNDEQLLMPVLETKDKPRISYSEIRGYSEIYPADNDGITFGELFPG